MIDIVFKKAVEEYLNNLKVMFSFGLLFVFVILFLFFEQFFFVSGTIHLVYSEFLINILGLLLGLIFLYFFSFFISLVVYSTKRDVQKVTFDIYWNVLLKNVSIKIFSFYFIISIIFYSILLIGLYFDLLFFSSLIVLIISILTMFVPQSIVLDENDLLVAFKESVLFWKNNFFISSFIVLLGSVLLLLIVLLEFFFEFFHFPGIIISSILVLIFLIPFIEQLKSYSFILKFNLIKQSEILSARIKTRKKMPINAIRLRQKTKKGKI